MSDLPNFNYDPSSLPPPPPSSVHGEIDEDDNHLPVDDSFHHRDVNFDSTNEDENHQHINGVRDNTVDGTEADEVLASIQNDQSQPPILPSPQQPELTLKEKLVLRERQQRIETERARLKRQFALSSTNEEIDTLNNDDGTLNRTQDDINHPAMESLPGDIDDTTGNYNGREFEEESTRAHPDEEEAVADEANRRLGFNMERFLRNSESFHPELENALEADRTMPSGESSTDATKGVVMERFLNDMVSNTNHMLGEVEPTEQTGEPHRSVSFDVDATVTTQVLPHSVQSQMLNHQQESLLTSMHPSFGGESTGGVSIVSNASMRTEANTVHDEYFNTVDPPLYSSSSLENMHETDRASLDDVSSRVSDDEPRVLRLTEADMLEMAAIEEASIGNAPPSDRDEVESYSEIGELTDFGGSGGGMHRFLGDPTFNGPDTPTTALESASQLSQRSAAHIGGTSALSSSATNEHTDVDIFAGHLDLIEGMPIPASDRSHYFVASASASVAANPPSEGERDDDDDDEIMDNESHLNDVDLGTRTDDNAGVLPYSFSVNDGIANLPSSDLGSDTVGAADASHVDVAPIANRPRHYNPNDSSIDGSRIENAEHDNVVDGFDFDKDAPLSPFHNRTIRGALGNDDSFRNLPNDLWSPPGRMHISPLQVGDRAPPLIAVKESMAVPMPFESADIRSGERSTLTSIEDYKSSIPSEMTPLLSGDSPHLATDMLESRRGTTFTIAESDPVCTDALITEKKTGNSASFLEKGTWKYFCKGLIYIY